MTLTELNARLQDHSLFQKGGLIVVRYPNNATLRENLSLLFPLFQRGPWPVEEIVEQTENEIGLPSENKAVFCIHAAKIRMFELLGLVARRLRQEAVKRGMLVVFFVPINYPNPERSYLGTTEQDILSRAMTEADMSLIFALDNQQEPVFYIDKLRYAELIRCQNNLCIPYPVKAVNFNPADPYRTAEQVRLRQYVRGYRDEDSSYPGYLPTDTAIWEQTTLSPTELEPLFTHQQALDWLTNEIVLSRGQNGRAADYLQMLGTGITDPVVITVSPDGQLRVGDGWHRIAIAIIRREPVKAVVGRFPTNP